MPTWFEIYIAAPDGELVYHGSYKYSTLESAEVEARALLQAGGLGGRALVQTQEWATGKITPMLHLAQLWYTVQGKFDCAEDARTAATIAIEAREYRAAVNGA